MGKKWSRPFVGTLLILAGVFSSIKLGSAQIALPQLGFKVEGESIRPIWGIPGSSRTGEPLKLSALFNVEISSDQQYLLGVRAEDHVLIFVDVRNPASPAAAAIDEAFLNPELLAISPSGSAAAIFSLRDHAVQIVLSLPNPSRIAATFPVSNIDEVPTALAVSDDGATVLLAANGYLWTVDKSGVSKFGPARGRISAIQFLRNSQDAVVADQKYNQLLLIKADEPGNQKSLIYSSGNGISQPMGIGISKDNKRLFVANANTGTVAIGKVAGGEITLVPCGCKIAGWDSLGMDSAFRMTDPGGASYIIDAHTNVPHVSFVRPSNGQ